MNLATQANGALGVVRCRQTDNF